MLGLVAGLLTLARISLPSLHKSFTYVLTGPSTLQDARFFYKLYMIVHTLRCLYMSCQAVCNVCIFQLTPQHTTHMKLTCVYTNIHLVSCTRYAICDCNSSSYPVLFSWRYYPMSADLRCVYLSVTRSTQSTP